MEFKDVLAKLRTDHHLSQVALAERLHVSAGLIGMYESGRRMPSIEAQEILADFFNVSLDYLMGRDTKSQYCMDPKYAVLIDRIDRDRPFSSAVALLSRLDDTDLIRVTERMETLLEDDKYKKGIAQEVS